MTTFTEAFPGDHGQTLSMETILHEGRTAHQEALVFTNGTFGKVLALDGIVQLTELDTYIYHEMIAHVPLMAHHAPRDVLIIGGGDGGVLKEVLKHPVGSATLVEIDPELIALSQKFFPELAGAAFTDPRASIVIGDGATFVTEASDRFDVIIVDSTDPAGPGEALFSDAFYRRCRAVLRPDGVISVQSGTPFYQWRRLDRMLARLTDVFGAAQAFLAPVPTYAHGLLALIVAAADHTFCPAAETLAARFGGIETAYYSPQIHRAAFVAAPCFGPRRDDRGRRADEASISQLPQWITRPVRGGRRRKAPATRA